MSVRKRIREIKHLQNKYFICVLENPTDIVNIASAIRNISAFGVTKLYAIGGDKNLLRDFGNPSFALSKGRKEGVEPSSCGPQPHIIAVILQPS